MSTNLLRVLRYSAAGEMRKSKMITENPDSRPRNTSKQFVGTRSYPERGRAPEKER